MSKRFPNGLPFAELRAIEVEYGVFLNPRLLENRQSFTVYAGSADETQLGAVSSSGFEFSRDELCELINELIAASHSVQS